MSQSWQIMEIQLSQPAGAWAGFCIHVANAHVTQIKMHHVQGLGCGMRGSKGVVQPLVIFSRIGMRGIYSPFSRDGKDAEDAFTRWWCWPLPASIISTTSQQQKGSGVLGLQSRRKAVSKYKAVFPAKNTGKANSVDIQTTASNICFQGRSLKDASTVDAIRKNSRGIAFPWSE